MMEGDKRMQEEENYNSCWNIFCALGARDNGKKQGCQNGKVAQ